jgi:uncharacterized protein involved in exopolysaccharide biosynthesis
VLLEFLSELLDAEEQNMLDAEKAILEFKQDNNIASVEREMQSLQDLIRQLKLERERTLMDRDQADIFAQTYRDEEQAANDKADEIEEMSAEMIEAGTQEEDEEFAPATKQYYRDLARQHAATATNYEAQRDSYIRRIEIYDQAINERVEELNRMIELSDEYQILERDLQGASDNYNFLASKATEAELKLAQAERLGYIQITEPARKPDQPEPSKTLQLTLVGGVVAILAGFVLSFVIEFIGSLARAARTQRVG